MRYYLDTNTLIFLINSDNDNIHFDVKAILEDYSNTLFVSSIAVQELLFLFRIGKITMKSKGKNEEAILSAINNLGIEIRLFNEKHFGQYTLLKIADKHKDLIDHMIVSQSINEKIPLISSDNIFNEYVPQGLKFVFNKR
jgi:PIN domain nuclease of toxin-antitoxin system